MLGQHPMLEMERENQNDVAHSLTVGMMAYHLQRAFRAYPDDKGQSIIERIFVWICGKSIQQAIDDKDDRTVNTNGVSDPGEKQKNRFNSKILLMTDRKVVVATSSGVEIRITGENIRGFEFTRKFFR